jgi:non-specific serine/threonine protein kinase
MLTGGDEINLTEMKDEDLLRMMALDLKSVMAG